MRKSLIAGALLLAAAMTPAEAAFVYSPGPEYETTEAPSNGVMFVHHDSTHLQVGISRSLFGDAAVEVTQMAFRTDSIYFQGHISRYDFNFGRTTIKAGTVDGLNTMSGVFADNLRSNPATVLDRDYVVNWVNSGPAAGPRDWNFVFNFDNPYYYDPTAGDLVLDLATTNRVDLFGTVDYIRSGSLMRTVFAYGGATTIGRGDAAFDGGPITRVAVRAPELESGGGASQGPGAVPEPATWAMMILGFGLVGGAVRRRQRTLAVQA